jgi:hypothetical protein
MICLTRPFHSTVTRSLSIVATRIPLMLSPGATVFPLIKAWGFVLLKKIPISFNSAGQGASAGFAGGAGAGGGTVGVGGAVVTGVGGSTGLGGGTASSAAGAGFGATTAGAAILTGSFEWPVFHHCQKNHPANAIATTTPIPNDNDKDQLRPPATGSMDA